MAFGDDVARRGWQTGSVFSNDTQQKIAPHLTHAAEPPARVEAGDWVIVVSQICDVRADKLEDEPYIEVLHCRCQPAGTKPRKGFRELRSTRRLDFRPNQATHAEVVLTAHALADRYTVPRSVVAEYDPDPTRKLSEDSAARILAWYALRASRPSWPNEFVRRIRAAKDALEDALDFLAEDVAQVRVGILEKSNELGVEQSYHIVVYFVVDEATWNFDFERRTKIHGSFGRFVGALSQCAGVEIDQELSQVVPGNEFTWQQAQTTDEWNFANLSHRDS